MNFNVVAANNGNLVAMFATIAEIGASKLNVNQKPIQSVTLTDDNGEQHKVTINKGNGELLDGSALGQRLSFNLSTYQGQHGVGYSGFWNSRAQVSQPTPQNAPQAPPKAPQRPSANKDRLIVAQVVYKELSSKFANVGEFDVWLSDDGHNVLSRHIDSIMLLASYKTADGEPNF